MPIYEYLCPNCNGRFQKLVSGFRDPQGLACPRCGNAEVQRAVSRVSVLKSEESRAESLADPSMFSGLDENDPRSIARWAKRLGKELGDEAGEDWDEMVDQMLEEELNNPQGNEPESDSDDAPKATKVPKKPDNLGWA